MDRTPDAHELLEQVVALQRVSRALDDPEERRRVAKVIRQLRARLGVGVPKHRAAAALGVSAQALERWVRAGAIPVTRRPGSSRELIDSEALIGLVGEVERLHEAGYGRPLAKAIEALEGAGRLRRKLRPNQPARELRYEFLHTSAAERLRSGIELTHTAHALAAHARARKARASV